MGIFGFAYVLVFSSQMDILDIIIRILVQEGRRLEFKLKMTAMVRLKLNSRSKIWPKANGF
jgi:hypothetical protein